MHDNLFIVAIDIGGQTVPALLPYSEERYRRPDPAHREEDPQPEPPAPQPR